MRLTQLLDSLQSRVSLETNFLYLERYVNDTKGDFINFSDVDPRYSPECGVVGFDAPFVRVKHDMLTIFQDQPSSEVFEAIFEDDTALFVWHPDIPSPFKVVDGHIMVSPTSSTRTLLTRKLPHNFMAKTDLDKRHFRFIRRLKGSSVEHSISINRDIRLATETGAIPFYAYLPEVIGLVYGDMQTGTGVLYRELQPRPLVQAPRVLVPYFALYSSDSFFPQDKPLMFDLIERNNAYDPVQFFVEVLIGLIQDTWAYFVANRALLPELHGQNTCLEIDANGVPTRLVHRDFQSLYSDRVRRDMLSLPQFKKHHVGEEDNITKEQQYSLIFDHFISNYLFMRMVNTFVALYPQYAFNDVTQQIQDRFCGIQGNPLDVFPDKTHCFGKKNMIGNEVVVVSTGKVPLFR